MGNNTSGLSGYANVGSSDNAMWRLQETLLRMPISELQTTLSKNGEMLKTIARVMMVRGEQIPPELRMLLTPAKSSGNVMMPSSVVSMPGMMPGNMMLDPYQPNIGSYPQNIGYVGMGGSKSKSKHKKGKHRKVSDRKSSPKKK